MNDIGVSGNTQSPPSMILAGFLVSFAGFVHILRCPALEYTDNPWQLCLAALVPKPRVNLTRYYGAFAPNSQHRALVTPARRGRGSKAKASGPEDATPVASHAAMNWAQRLKRVFAIDIETCRACGGSTKVIACCEDPLVIKKILTHLRGKGLYQETAALPQSRAPPQQDLFS